MFDSKTAQRLIVMGSQLASTVPLRLRATKMSDDKDTKRQEPWRQGGRRLT